MMAGAAVKSVWRGRARGLLHGGALVGLATGLYTRQSRPLVTERKKGQKRCIGAEARLIIEHLARPLREGRRSAPVVVVGDPVNWHWLWKA